MASNSWLWFLIVMASSAIVMESTALDSTASDVIATRIREYMDTNINPCDNFYKYVCGNFLKTAIVPDDRRTPYPQNAVMEKVKTQLIDMLKKPSSSTELKAFKIMKQFYNRCLDQKRIDEEGFGPVTQLLNRLGGWPILEGERWNDETWSWEEFTHKCRVNGLSESYFLDLSMISNPMDTTKSILSIQSPHAESLAYEYDHTDDAKYQMVNSKYIVYIAKMMAGNASNVVDAAKVQAAMAEVLQFTMDLMKISEPVRGDGISYRPMTLKEMSVRWPNISWLDYFSKLLPKNVRVDKNEIINVVHPDYLTKFVKLIESTPKKIQANFGIWQILLDLMGLLPSQVQQNRVKDLEILGLPSSFLPRDEYCYGVTNSFFSISMNALYIRENILGNDKQSVTQIVTGIKDQLFKTLEEIEWMDHDTKERSLEKVASITTYISYRNRLIDDQTLEHLYSSFPSNCDSFLQCYLNAFSHIVDNVFSELKQSVDENYWTERMLRVGVDISYSPNKNSITIPAEILQDIIFERTRPDYVNYGVLGSIIAEKMLNSFDHTGRMYDKNGNLNEVWSNSTKEKFNRKAECLINQYSNYFVDEVGMTLDGTYNVESNIVRHGGVKLAYQSYHKWMINNGAEILLPKFNMTYTPEKLFWISLANAYCVRMHPEYLRKYIKYGRLIPPEFRINGALLNMPEFSRDFNCSKGSKMRRPDTCAVW